MPISKNSPVRVRKAERTKRLLELRKEGLSYAKIAEKEGISRRRVRELVSEAFEGLLDAKNEVAADALKRVLKGLDELREAVWDEAMEGDVKAVGAALAILDREARLLGLDAPARGQAEIQFKGIMATAELASQAAALGVDLEALRGPAPPVLQLTQKTPTAVLEKAPDGVYTVVDPPTEEKPHAD
jgi:transcriptional regulator with XRE-family HTH domain